MRARLPRREFMTLQTALVQGTKLLEEGAIAAPRLTAEVLLAHALRRERAYLYAHPEEALTELAWIHYGRYLHERLKGKPTQYITGRQEFYGREFRVTSDVLIPRPETEHLVEASLKVIRPGDTVVDVGAGSGAIAVTLALETGARVFATDISLAALCIAADNARRLAANVSLLACDLALRSATAASTCWSRIRLTCRAPIATDFSARSATGSHMWHYSPDPTGVEIYERLIAEARRVLRPGGWLLVELGYNSVEPVRAMLGAGWSEIAVEQDLAGLPRVLSARMEAMKRNHQALGVCHSMFACSLKLSSLLSASKLKMSP